MKKVFMCLILLSMLIPQIDAKPKGKVAIDKVEDDGTRTIVARGQKIWIHYWVETQVMLTAHITPNDTIWGLKFMMGERTELTLDEGRKLLIKTEDGTIYTFYNNSYVTSTYESFKDPLTGAIMHYYKAYPEYTISKDELFKIMSGKIIKVRIDHSFGEIDENIKSNNFSSALIEQYKAIREAMKVQKTVYSDF